MLKKISLILLIVCMMVLMTACKENANSPSKKATTNTTAASNTGKNELVVAIPADVGTIDPAVTMDNTSWKIIYSTYERLVDYDGATTNIKPGLAKKWTVSKDGKTWTFTLEKGHTFADGTPVDAAAVKTSFERTLKIASGPAGVFNMISKISVNNPTTITFKLSENFPPFLSALATNYGNIVSPKIMEHEKDGDLGQNYLANHTMGSGPYQLTDWKKGDSITLGLNPHSKVKPALKNIVFKIVSDSSVQRMQLQKGEIDIAEGIPVDQMKDVKKLNNVQLIQKPSLTTDYVYINTSKGNPALKNAKVRQALNDAIDYDSLIDAVQLGYATKTNGPIPDGIWGHDKTAKPYKHSVKKAKALLAEAGVKHLTLNLLYSDNKSWWKTEALTIQSNMADIGVKVNLKSVAYATSRDMIDKGDFDLALGVWSPDFGDPYGIMNYWYDSKNFGLAGNRAFYKNSKVDQLLQKAATNNNKTTREQLYKQVQGIVMKDAPYILLYQKNFTLPMNKNVKGFVYNPMLDGIYNLSEMSK
ncbi:ABC transporter substrate-binding protein [Heyndrickxia ginsengihumi]|uniref:ABC transporter substrate-binding protein n=1 Tax=Heyndrickxia ginsengihumi TaxID=363870 RepID=A0A0A6VAP1_9BACI|nr:ABC transporter substrate-binding protein [Heyndrickxia ginsengihumi]KHD85275.1 peptide ABC transporter substrate-binding protein [Heyndrickxia ginsengihumi]MBE6183524.1 ABC transporter substrate-binding protein [Bacillus sp. (in: firmicutes)]MCM3023228.1 ABC transporter substrate-binding protein [Heyndrickxia ginsengihumi]NEY19325.1 ABC transporter substrate-binding protein [Heyndrickxia ginsengihumi]